jgi:hypothetical protein
MEQLQHVLDQAAEGASQYKETLMVEQTARQHSKQVARL